MIEREARRSLGAAETEEEMMTRRQSKSMLLGFGIALTVPMAALAQDAPQFMQETMPKQAVDPAWQEFQSISDPEGALND